MRTLVTCKLNLVWIFFLSLGVVSAQERYKESFDASKDMVVSVNTAYANVIFETWNKNKVEVEAFVEGDDLTKEEKKEIFDNWKLEVLGNSKKVTVTSQASRFGEGIGSIAGLEALKSLKGLESLKSLKGLEALKLKELKNIPHLEFDFDFKVPEVPEFKSIPHWPFTDASPNIKHKGKGMNLHFGGLNGNSFDRGEYEKDKKGYVAKLNKKYDSNVSVREVDQWLAEVDDWASEFEDVMESWGENFGKEFSEKFGPDFERKMEKWGEEFGEKFGKEMEKWGEEFGAEFEKDMEKWGEEFGKEMEEWAKRFEEESEQWAKSYEDGGKNVYLYKLEDKDDFHGKANKTIIIRMPKNTKTEVQVRHGELKMANAYDLKATLNYAKFTANSIDGGNTLINASYAPVHINTWGSGALQVNYVEDCRLNSVRSINLQSNSSDVNINEVLQTGLLSGSFGNLFVAKVAPGFETIDIVLENTDAVLKLPNTAFDFYFNGKKSRIESPKTLTLKETNSFDRKLLKGYHQSNNSGKSISINASYSKVSVQ